MRLVATWSSAGECHGVKISFLKNSLQGAFLSWAPCSFAYCSHCETASITWSFPLPKEETCRRRNNYGYFCYYDDCNNPPQQKSSAQHHSSEWRYVCVPCQTERYRERSRIGPAGWLYQTMHYRAPWLWWPSPSAVFWLCRPWTSPAAWSASSTWWPGCKFQGISQLVFKGWLSNQLFLGTKWFLNFRWEGLKM